jgi:hypothetical protein
LATLPRNRFKDLASDVFHELRRRYPEFDEQEVGPDVCTDGLAELSNVQATERAYDTEPNSAPNPQPIRPSYTTNPSQNSLRSAPTPPISRLNSSNSSQHQRQGSRGISASSSGSGGGMHRSQPSRENNIGPDRSAATNEVVVPNKSRMREEEIEVPYARDSVVEPLSGRSSRAGSMLSREERDRDRARTPRERERGDMTEVLSPASPTNDEREYYDRMSFSSNVTNKSKAVVQGGGGGGWDEEREKKIRAEYEFRIAGLERRAAVAESEREEARKREGEERVRRKEWEDEVRGLKEVRNAKFAERLSNADG